jgi:hypothetical protein
VDERDVREQQQKQKAGPQACKKSEAHSAAVPVSAEGGSRCRRRSVRLYATSPLCLITEHKEGEETELGHAQVHMARWCVDGG